MTGPWNLRPYAAAALIFALALTGCGSKQQQQTKKPPVPVLVGTVSKKTVPVQIRAIGNVEAVSTIQVKSQIGGLLTKVHFKEGQEVAKGALLFTIDPRPYEALLKQAEANLARSQAQMGYAKEEARRYEALVSKGYVARDQYEQVRANAAALEATVNADRATVENARLQLKYCYIHSPVTGRIGNLQSYEGNLIKASADTAMVTINQIRPINVTYSVPEQQLAEIRRYMSKSKLAVEAFLSKDDREPERGTLSFIDNTVDPATGTIRLKGVFANTRNRLWPGQFVNVVITLTTQPDAVLAPTAAVQTGQSGQFVFVVKSDNTVESRPVVASRAINDETVIDKGLTPGETVVTDGQLRLAPGALVEIKRPEKAPAAAGQARPADTGKKQ